jgi:hypothetical protein
MLKIFNLPAMNIIQIPGFIYFSPDLNFHKPAGLFCLPYLCLCQFYLSPVKIRAAAFCDSTFFTRAS